MIQEWHLHRLTKVHNGYPVALGVLLGWHPRSERLYIGHPNDSIFSCPSVPKPKRLDSADWPISELLSQYAPPWGWVDR